MKKIILLMLAALLICTIPLAGMANSAEPPGLTVIMKSAPADLEAEVISGNIGRIFRVDKFGESYFQIYIGHLYTDDGSPLGRDLVEDLEINFHNDTEESTFKIKLSDFGTYSGTVTFDFRTGEVHNGKLLSRTVFLIVMRVVLTLLIEGLILLLFRFRQKRTWLIFLLMNLITQGALSYLMNRFGGQDGGYFVYTLLFLGIVEVAIMAFELIVFAFAAKERKAWQRIVYVLVANVVSWVFGGVLITYFPV